VTPVLSITKLHTRSLLQANDFKHLFYLNPKTLLHTRSANLRVSLKWCGAGWQWAGRKCAPASAEFVLADIFIVPTPVSTFWGLEKLMLYGL
jgi:hypothetical protein